MQEHKLEGVPFYQTQNFGMSMEPEAIVLHYSSGRNLMSTVRWFQSTESRSSAHVIIGRDGKIAQMVPFNVSALHCGMSSLNGKEKCNQFTIGIELCNWGKLSYRNGMYYTAANTAVHEQDVVAIQHKFSQNKLMYWEKYTEDQVLACIDVCKRIVEKYPKIKLLVGHDDVAYPQGREVDPGPALDMSRIRKEIGFEDNSLKSNASRLMDELVLVKKDMETAIKRIDKLLSDKSDDV